MKRLYLFTNFYPYSHIECFLEDEIIYLAREFDQVYLVPYFYDDEVRSFPNNCTLIPSEDAFPYKREICFNKKTIIPFIKEFFSEGTYKSKEKARRLVSSFFQINHVLNSDRIKKILYGLTPDDVLYFYWGVGNNAITAFVDTKAKTVSRFHGQWDLWEDEYHGYLPFRKKIMSKLDAVAAISSKGFEFIGNKYPYAKLNIFPLGSPDYGECEENRQCSEIRVLSCSYVIPLKRVDLIFRSLLEMKDVDIVWTHIGDGADFEKIKTMVHSNSHPRLKVNLIGRLDHEGVMRYMKLHKFDVFLNLSTLEGVPVSIMEAISFDIPVVATNVGGTSDVVKSESGLLVSANPSENEVADAIRKVVKGTYSPRKFWLNHYSAEKNYSKFSRFINNL